MAGNYIYGYLLGPDGVGSIVAVTTLFFLRSLNGKKSTKDTWISSAIQVPTDLAFVAFSLYFVSIGKQQTPDRWVGVYGLLYIIAFLVVHFLQVCSEHRHQAIKEKWQNRLLLLILSAIGMVISIVMLNMAFFEFHDG